MWCPKGYYSWNSVLSQLFETSEEVLSLVALGGEPITETNLGYRLVRTAESYLTSRGFASSHEEAKLNVAITTCFLMAKFLEDYPPVLAGLDRQIITVEGVFLEHRDQLHLCHYEWPLKSQSEFARFFEYVERGAFEPLAIFDRFAFIDAATGELRLKNGAQRFLNGYTAYTDESATRLIDLAKRLTGFVVCWEEFPDEAEFRNFLSYLEVDDTFIHALDYAFGPATESQKPAEEPANRPRGRPSKKGIARNAYWACFPEGHECIGKSWKEVLQAVEATVDVSIDITTLKRAVREGGQKGQK